ncbi:hypothetical protein [Wenjunlia tyrosinilytica]|uniref:Uncharacterized protein n=1 Tax=Wenjunlia tyrosinilytica TaxID=1544741 RepID=A0A917ZMF4_9ACTN|nr:hypothetical protein [Wenjunlia tyrosinilytica]GGO86221.1 hypothetical protein GCM10012280_21820 [Wenjunlia tyrosinilytica]
MRSLSRDGIAHWPRSALVATGLGIGAVGGFLGGLFRDRRGGRMPQGVSRPMGTRF